MFEGLFHLHAEFLHFKKVTLQWCRQSKEKRQDKTHHRAVKEITRMNRGQNLYMIEVFLDSLCIFVSCCQLNVFLYVDNPQDVIFPSFILPFPKARCLSESLNLPLVQAEFFFKQLVSQLRIFQAFTAFSQRFICPTSQLYSWFLLTENTYYQKPWTHQQIELESPS